MTDADSARTAVEAFGLIVIGDEILSGKRRDRHVEGIGDLLRDRGFRLAWVQILPDDPPLLVDRLRQSMAAGLPVFSCGGIGATPDDHTRQCAAAAAGVPVVRHPGAVAEIEARFGAEAYPTRIRMAELPEGCELIPNPYNRIPGFRLRGHHFLPGFPDMAHPMAAWVLDTHYPQGGQPECECALRIFEVSESQLIDLMEDLVARHPQLSLFSLPRLGESRSVELGLRGREGLDAACAELRAAVEAAGWRYEPVTPPSAP